jgi:hypothetical protein
MRFDETVKGLSPGEVAALEKLKAKGWTVALDVGIDDLRRIDGNGLRTYALQGRYPIAIFRSDIKLAGKR